MITPDTKDWTWVLQRPCPDCGLDTSGFDREDVAVLLRENAAAWQAVLAREDVGVRPDENTWSPLEYACHVRDACRVFAERLELMLTTENPGFPNWDQDKTAAEERYGEQDPARVAVELTETAATLAAGFEAVRGDAWSRTGNRSDGARFTVESFARYFIHDPVHHLHDVKG
ncbi:DinB family protein [Amycolatopsis acidiphila]|uniref:DinB family protein n=1 Tax=Amycolatopsis acidiphila TaxID=715473 RepID=A0A557ZND1_9PSEU|nr:DinB family protein [Amycolatopsis acidiphila]TVT13501.1 DinB family protein [Amycolatopsis acidiphila]UIJ60904.1 DinB family protein [Amycolatopsis acidiphila]